MVVNGHSKLACTHRIAVELARGSDEIVIRPLRTMQVIKDLVVDMAPYWTHWRDVEPYLQPDPNRVPGTMAEYTVRPEQLAPLRRDLHCIQCGVCYSDCSVKEVSGTFAGPAALARAHRFVTDPRDSRRRERLARLIDLGLWACARSYECMECPKHVEPADAIEDLRRLSIQDGLVDNRGARYTQTFTRNMGRKGRLNEGALVRESVADDGMKGLLALAPQGARMALRGKMPLPVFQRKVANYSDVRRIYDALSPEPEGEE
jgi:succinate dehydrogenase / fumarate reductase iron-sulfur subunit